MNRKVWETHVFCEQKKATFWMENVMNKPVNSSVFIVRVIWSKVFSPNHIHFFFGSENSSMNGRHPTTKQKNIELNGECQINGAGDTREMNWKMIAGWEMRIEKYQIKTYYFKWNLCVLSFSSNEQIHE